MKLVTDAQGRTSVELKPGMQWFQIWVDGYSGCIKPPDRIMVSDSSVLFDEGVIVSNTCSPALLRLAPDYLVTPTVVPVNVWSAAELQGKSEGLIDRSAQGYSACGGEFNLLAMMSCAACSS
jgi:hypothetical protein